MVFSFFFTPQSVNYRIFSLPGFVLFLAPALETHYGLTKPSIKKAWPIAILILALFGTNFTLKHLPESDSLRNPLINESFRLAQVFNEGDLLIYSGAEEDYLRADYVRYFVQCDTILLPALIAS